MRTKEGWTIEETVSWFHVVPENDIAYHRLGVFCSCQPVPDSFEAGCKRVLVHNAFDAREFGFVVDAIAPIQLLEPKGTDAIFFSSRYQ